MSTTRSPLHVLVIVLSGLIAAAGTAGAQHGGGGQYGAGHNDGGRYGTGSYYGVGSFGGRSHLPGYYGHSGGYLGGHWGYGGLYGFLGPYGPVSHAYFPWYYAYPYYHDYGRGGGNYAYGAYAYPNTGAVRLEVEPDDARVFVDGAFAGIVDDFRAPSQPLRVSAGPHEIALEREGYRTRRVKVFVPTGQTLRIQERLSKGAGEDADDSTSDAHHEGSVDALSAASTDRGERPSVSDDLGAESQGGHLRLSVEPDDAAVYIDGEFRGLANRLGTLALLPGRHSIEVIRPGFRVLERTVEVESQRSLDLVVRLKSGR